MSYRDLEGLIYLNQQELDLEEVQARIDLARVKYHDVGEIQLKLDRRQEALDRKKREIMQAKSLIVNPN